MAFASVFASPTPMFSVIFWILGTCITDASSELVLEPVAQLQVVERLEPRRAIAGLLRDVVFAFPAR